MKEILNENKEAESSDEEEQKVEENPPAEPTAKLSTQTNSTEKSRMSEPGRPSGKSNES